MSYTELKIEPEALADRSAILRQGLVNKGKDPMAVVIESVMKRFAMHGKARYTDYGPYWFALKGVLNRQGKDLGDYTDDEIVRAYAGKDDFETVVAADMFRDFNLASNPVRTVNYALDGYTGEEWALFDPDMELPA